MSFPLLFQLSSSISIWARIQPKKKLKDLIEKKTAQSLERKRKGTRQNWKIPSQFPYLFPKISGIGMYGAGQSNVHQQKWAKTSPKQLYHS